LERRCKRRGKVMDDPNDPIVSEKDVPSFNIVENKIKEIDNSIIIYRVYYFFNTFMYRFQLIKQDKMCMLDIPRSLLENLSKDGTTSEQQLLEILNVNIEDSECWSHFEG
jgi:hypothetical protein